ncbi:glycoside hydrolase family 3 N-terminal domain-containing protein [Roseicyclus sp. F158]|uniref:beta-N-acetylhexosaminidase n=1 Tax=Tropicimonas omnivorans TaxID=3075590 RepID=A0ABU3DIQ7_9RHOB|nr:glycoside hydrolase family 3 N-terminal domain-containing protein [Roseicyclus sp. F158]MDT0683598.1 glycoside hydrolase family 3 N-terminal domain-containing protein [Roseicyclus sp. F158]
MSETGATILGCAGQQLSKAEAAFFREAAPWGFILFSRNVGDAEQLRALCGDLREAVGREAPILIDQEGGRVHRLAPPLGRAWPAPLDHAEAASDAARALFLRYRLIAAELRDVGIDANCAPMADVAEEATHLFLKNRCYGVEPGVVARRARAVAEGLMAGGVLPVLKHVPGHGRARADSHLELPVVRASKDELEARDFAAFRPLGDLPLAMTAHIVYSAFDADRPATTSPRMIRHIRDGIGIEGLLMTDDISMQALHGPMVARAEDSIAAGCDVVLHCNGEMAEMEQVVAGSGTLWGAAARRADAAIAARRAPEDLDIAEAEEELRALGGMAGDG